MRLLAPCPVVDFEAYGIYGDYFRLSDVRNKVRVLFFFVMRRADSVMCVQTS